MDLRKIGKLIAKLRNDKKLTQQELGDLVGVGFRTVSKWERGLNLPDIENINELSKIFNVTKEEILNGELKVDEMPEEIIPEETNNEETPNKNIKVKVIISIITVIILFISSLIIYNTNKEYVYTMQSINEEEYYIEGNLTMQKNEITIKMERLQIKDINGLNLNVKNYQYEIISGKKLIFGYGESLDENNLNEVITIENFMNNLKINYNGKTTISHKEVIENKLYLKLTLWDDDSKEITKNIEIALR